MPIKSYILHCKDFKKKELLLELQTLQQCEVIPAKNHDIIVLVTDTQSEFEDKELYNSLLKLKNLKHLSMVSGFDTK